MNLLKKLKQKAFKRSVDLVEWVVHTPKCTLWRLSPYFAYLKYGALLRVRKEQMAILMSNGKFADVYKPGEYKLTYQSMPILAKMKGWTHSFNAPFKADVYFINTKHFEDMSWSTSSPILIDDSMFGPIYITAYGSYSFRVGNNPKVYIMNVVGNNKYFTTNEVIEQLRKFVVSMFTDYLMELNIGAQELKTQLNEFSNDFTNAMQEDFSDYGIELTQFEIKKVTLPQAVEAALSKELSMRSVDNVETYKKMNFEDMFKGTNRT